jgi:hypothetical protein
MSDTTPKTAAERLQEEQDRLVAHRDLATLGERLVPLESFRQATAAAGSELSSADRESARRSFLGSEGDGVEVEGPYRRIAVMGGVYNNHRALEALLADAAGRGIEALYCLGDLGGFGPSPEKVRALLSAGSVRVIQGNYEQSLAAGNDDCNCGYTDPRDNHFAALSYDYTNANISDEFRSWMGELPTRRRVRVGGQELLLVHGSPRRVNEFLFESTTPSPFLETLLDQERCDAMLCTHTGLHWQRTLPSGRQAINVGVIGRPANDGATHVWYTLLDEHEGQLRAELVPLEYDHLALADEMRQEELPAEFIETILTGWWTTCLEVLPAKEREASRF